MIPLNYIYGIYLKSKDILFKKTLSYQTAIYVYV